MDHLVVFGARAASPFAGQVGQRLEVDGVTVSCGLVGMPMPHFNPESPAHREAVLLRVRAFSCNYRDKAFVRSLRNVPAQRFSTIGSEFVADVVAAGCDVPSLVVGDRVISDHHFEGATWIAPGVRGGVVTNQASRGYHVVSARKVRRIPSSMPDDVAATFSLNAQTAYSMLRRLELRPGSNVLVTSAVSNASLFTLAAIRAHDVRVYAATSSARWVDRLRAIGAEDVLVVERNLAGFRDAAHVGEFAATIGGFDYVIDPFFDLHIEKAVEIMNPFGRYITCGLVGQNEFAAASAGVATRAPSANLLLGQMMMKNLTLIGNCIGLSSDLDAAVRDYERGSFRPPLDAVFSGEQAAGFLDRTFNDPDRFGKVAFRYEH
jgi:NADPH:quinone reductase-like Zn-dependent oxidoreductase